MFGNKPTFGSTTGFGTAGTFGNASTPFGQATPAFGANKPLGSSFSTQPFGSTQQTSSVFGGGGGGGGGTSTTGASTSLFGSGTSSFGQTATAPSSGFGFGASAANPSLFASNPQQSTSTGMFGNTSGSAFGAPKSTFGGFGATPTSASMFSQQQQQQQPQSSIMFNQSPATGSNLFGGSSFGASTSTAVASNLGGANGTNIKFVPVTGSDTMMKNGVATNINTRHMCITVMKEYEYKSLEELRMEDYLLNRKGPQSTALAFGGSNQTAGLFSSAAPASGNTSTLFGQSQNKPLFGTSTGGFGTSASGTGIFGQPQQQNVSPFAAKPLTFGTAATTQQGSTFSFGNPAATTFGTAGQQNKTMFGQTPLSTGGGLFSSTTPAAQPTPAFGTGMNFGSTFGTQNQNALGPFAAKPLGFGTATTTPAFSFGTNTTTNTGTFSFNQKPLATNFGIGGGVGGFGTAGGVAAAAGGGVGGVGGTGGFAGFGATAGGVGNTSSLFGQVAKPQLGGGFGNSGGFGTGLQATGGSFFGNVGGGKPGALGLGSGFGGGGGTTSAFGTNPGLGTGMSSFSFALPTVGSDLNAAQFGVPSAAMQQQLLALTTSPYGDSPLFRNLLRDPARSDDVLKPTNPEVQKSLGVGGSSLYKVSPRATVKVKLKPLSALNARKLFGEQQEDEDDGSAAAANDMFLPRRSVKKLVLKSRPESRASASCVDLRDDERRRRQQQQQEGVEHGPGVVVSPPSLTRDVRSVSPIRSPLFAAPAGNRLAASPTSPVSDREASPGFRMPTSRNLAIQRAPRGGMDDDDNTMALLKSNRARNIAARRQQQQLEGDDEEGDEVDEVAAGVGDKHPGGLVLQRPLYYTIPTLDELANMVDEDGNCFVENFTVGRESYGNVYFPGITNVSRLNLDEIVFFRRKELTIYPSDDLKPPVGHGLNKRAQITLDCVWPNDKTTRSPIKSLERLRFLNYQDKLEKVTAKLGAKFIEYRPETGSWVFQVNHFSKYGLDDSDEDEVAAAGMGSSNGDVQALQTASLPPEELLKQQQKQQQLSEFPTRQFPGQEQQQQTAVATCVPLRLRDSRDDDEELDGGVMQETFPEANSDDCVLSDPEELPYSVSHRFADSSRVQSMKASFFWNNTEGTDDDDGGKLATTDRFAGGSVSSPPPDKLGGLSRRHSAEKVRRLADWNVAYSPPPRPACNAFARFALVPGGGVGFSPDKLPRETVDGVGCQLLPLERSSYHRKQHLLADFACFVGRAFRVGWGRNFTLVYPGKPSLSSRVSFDSSGARTTLGDDGASRSQFFVVVERIALGPVVDQVTIGHVDECMQAQLSLTRVVVEGGCPLAVPSPGPDAIHRQAEIAQRQLARTPAAHPDALVLQQTKTVWELMVALWGRPEDEEDLREVRGVSDAYAVQVARRNLLSSWLQRSSAKRISLEIEHHQLDVSDGQLRSVFSRLTGLQVSEATRAARTNRDLSLSVLVSQAGGNCQVRAIVQQQLDLWQQKKVDRFVHPDRLKIYALLSGSLVWPSSCSLVNACDGLEWKRALALHLWFHCPPVASIVDAVSEYDLAYKGVSHFGPYAVPPRPVYMENGKLDDVVATFDVCYHLLKLFCDRSYRLDHMLTPTTHTPDPLDHRLSWLLFQALRALGYEHLSHVQSCNLACNYASQLVSMGLWHWAVFVLMHIRGAWRRKCAVLDVLRRCVFEATRETEEFLVERLLVPKEWIYEAKAIRERYVGNVHAEAFYVLRSGDWRTSHRLIMNHIAADAIITENYDYLKGLLDEFVSAGRRSLILDWEGGGQVYLDYLNLSQTVNRIRKGEVSAYELEGLRPEVTSLCHRVRGLQTRSAKERLCVSEMAKKAANLLRVVLALGPDAAATSHHLSQHIVRLPLPEDYGMMELKELADAYFMETSA